MQILIAAALGAMSSASQAAPLLMVHYMPWFQSAPYSGSWGWHWTMNHFDPSKTQSGRPQAASKYFPLIGLYDSNDEDALDCQALEMKFAGIDGAIIDWYGTDDYLDYAQNHRNTLHFIKVLKRAGLKFGVMYEDSTVGRLVEGHRIEQDDVITHGRSTMLWVQQNWFSDPGFLRSDGKPVFLVFGGGYYDTEQWNSIFNVLAHQPDLFTELGRRLPAIGGFGWPVPNGGTSKSFDSLDSFYTRARDWPAFISVAYPRFDDIYEQAQVHASWGSIDDADGETYVNTLTRAIKSGAPVVQIATFNDWGEGTQIEPSVEFGYRDLEATQRLRATLIPGPAIKYTPADLRLPVEWYLLTKHSGNSTATATRLKEALDLMFKGDLKKARSLIR